MASHAAGMCCIRGVKHEGTPVGKIEQIAGYPTYVSQVPGDAENKHAKSAVLILPDVLGHEYKNVQLIADQFAANGYAAYIPDLFEGDHVPFPDEPKPEGFDIMKWFSGTYNKTGHGHTPKETQPVVNALVKYLRTEAGFERIGSVGYCFGAKYVVRNMGFVANPGKSEGIDVGFVAHPSFVDEEELEKIKGPLSIAAAYHDQIFPPEKRRKSEDILVKVGQPYQINLYSHVEHGFAVKGDLTKQPNKFAKEKAFLQAVQWFDEYLNSPSKDSAGKI